MVVKHNLVAMNSNRMFNLTNKGQARSTEKLSSGYKINRAADDAAGLSISEKMRRQIRGIVQCSGRYFLCADSGGRVERSSRYAAAHERACGQRCEWNADNGRQKLHYDGSSAVDE